MTKVKTCRMCTFPRHGESGTKRQRLEIGTDVSFCLTSVEKDSMVMITYDERYTADCDNETDA